MKTLIIGCGYVGSAAALQLTERGHSVAAMRRKWEDRSLEKHGIHLVEADVTRAKDLEKITPDYDWVINCAAASGGGTADYQRIYVEGNLNAAKWLFGSPIRKYVYTSSTGVYGQDDGSDVTEESPTEPPSETGGVLAMAEQCLLDLAASGFPAAILRVAGIYGPERGYWLQQFLAGQARLEGDGSRILNMIHRDDVVGAIIAALEDGKRGEVYNAVDEEPATQKIVFEWLASTLKRPMPQAATEDSPPRRTVTNKRILNRKLREELGYAFRFPTFREGYTRALISAGVLPPR